MRLAIAVSTLALALTACSLPKSDFVATLDSGTPSIDPPGVLAIVVSSQTVAVDEGATVDFTVQLSQAPSAPLEVDLATPSQKIGLSQTKLMFDGSNFDVGQVVTVTGIPDDDTNNESAQITLTGAGVADVTIGATVHDLDTVQLVTTAVGGKMTVGEGGSSSLGVHLSHRPSADVTITAMMSGPPVTLDHPSLTIHTTDDYTKDVTFTLSAPVDQNIVDEMDTVTLAIAGGDSQTIMVTDIDSDKLGIVADPANVAALATLFEGMSLPLNITLSKQPPSAVTVTIANTTGNALVAGNSTAQLTFLPGNYNMPQAVTISAPQGVNTTNEADKLTLSVSDPANVTTVDVSVTIINDNVQSIQTTLTGALNVTEGSNASFGVMLAFQPASAVTVSLASVSTAVATVASSTGANFLTFTPTDYNVPSMHQVVVTGTQDDDLVDDSTTITLTSPGLASKVVTIDVMDDDHEAFVLSQTTTLSVPEGGMGTFTVALAFQPITAVTAMVTLTSTTPASLPITPSTLTFTTANWQTPQTVTLSPPVDNNNTAETGTVSIAATGIPTVMLPVADTDQTQVNSYGWPAPPAFADSFAMTAGQVIAYPVTVPASTLDQLAVFIPTASTDYRLAVYTDGGGVPGTLVASILRTTAVNGPNVTTIPDVPLAKGTYWIALRISQATSLSAGNATQTGFQCIREFNLNSLDDVWPNTFGTADCTTTNLLNLWITTYHQ